MQEQFKIIHAPCSQTNDLIYSSGCIIMRYNNLQTWDKPPTCLTFSAIFREAETLWGFTICLYIIMPNCSAVVGINMMQEEVKGIIFILFSSYNFVFYFTLLSEVAGD